MAHEFHESGPLVALSFLSPFIFGLLLSLFGFFASFFCLQKERFVIRGAVVGYRLVGRA
jgi:hypothetical protein